MLQLKLNNKCIQGERVTLELLFNNLSGLGFAKSHPSWQLTFDEYLETVSGLLQLKLRSGTRLTLSLPETGEILAESSVGKELRH